MSNGALFSQSGILPCLILRGTTLAAIKINKHNLLLISKIQQMQIKV